MNHIYLVSLSFELCSLHVFFKQIKRNSDIILLIKQIKMANEKHDKWAFIFFI